MFVLTLLVSSSFINFFWRPFAINLVCEEVKPFLIKRRIYRKIFLSLSMFKFISSISWQISMEINGLNRISLEISMRKKLVYGKLESVVITWKLGRFSRFFLSAFEYVYMNLKKNIFILQSFTKVWSTSTKNHCK